MDPLDFIGLARQLSESVPGGEAAWRTSIGRSYFAVFNLLKLRIDPVKALRKTDDVHDLVTRYLIAANHRELQLIGQTLKNLRASRNEADYDLDKTIAQDQSRLAFQRAQSAIAKSRAVADQTFESAIRAVPTIHRTPPT